MEPIDDVAGNAPAAEEAPAPQEQRRTIAGLVSGRLVNFKLAVFPATEEVPFDRGGCLRPFLVVDAKDATGEVTGVLFFHPEHDREYLPEGVPASPLGMAVISADYSDAGEPGKWGWPQREPVVASSVDAGALDTQVEGIRSDLAQSVNNKLADALRRVQEMLDGQSEMVKGLIADAGLTAKADATVVNAPPSSGAVGSGG